MKSLTRHDAEQLMHELAQATSRQRQLLNRYNDAMLKLQTELGSGLTGCEAEITAKSAALRGWAEAHPEEFPKDRKTIQLLAGSLGFRTGHPKLVPGSRAWNWEKVLAHLQATPLLQKFIRTRQEVDKEQILVAANSRQLDPAQLGLKVIQEESFYVTPNLAAVS